MSRVETRYTKEPPNRNDIPLWLKWVGSIIAIIVGGLTIWRSTIFYAPTDAGVANVMLVSSVENLNTATSTLNILEILNKALKLDTVLERQDFLNKYIGSKVFGTGGVKEITRRGDRGYFVDIIISGVLLTCSIERTDENEKRLVLLKGKTVSFTGTFSYTSIFDHGLAIDNCIL